MNHNYSLSVICIITLKKKKNQENPLYKKRGNRYNKIRNEEEKNGIKR